MSNGNVSFWVFIFVVIMFNIGCIVCFYIGKSDAEKMLTKINMAYQGQDPRDYLNLPEGQKDACLEWAFGKGWEEIDWKYRDDRFRDLHPELDPEDFAGYTPIILFWNRVQRAYLNFKETKK